MNTKINTDCKFVGLSMNDGTALVLTKDGNIRIVDVISVDIKLDTSELNEEGGS